MTLPAVIRIFFAIDLPSTTKDRLGEFICQLKRKAKTHAIRWSKPENLHITLQFLPEVHAEHLPLLIHHVRREVEGIVKDSSVAFSQLHLFPNPFRPRVIVLGIDDHANLSTLSGLIGRGIQAANYPIDDRPFRAHLTLGRIKHTHGVNLSFLAESELPPIEMVPVNEVILFRSEPQSDGSRYTPLERIFLKTANFKVMG